MVPVCLPLKLPLIIIVIADTYQAVIHHTLVSMLSVHLTSHKQSINNNSFDLAPGAKELNNMVLK